MRWYRGSSATINNKCTADPDAFKADAGWAVLEFSVDEPSQFQYQYVGNSATPTAYGIGDTDCDSLTATFTLNLRRTAAGNVQAEVIPPPPNVY